MSNGFHFPLVQSIHFFLGLYLECSTINRTCISIFNYLDCHKAFWHECAIVNATVVGSIATRGNEKYDIFIFFFGDDRMRRVLPIPPEFGRNWLMKVSGTECLKIRLPGPHYLTYYVQDSAWSETSIWFYILLFLV